MATVYKWIKVQGPRQQGAATYINIAEMEIRDATGNKVSTGGTAYAESQYDASYVPAKAFDGDTASAWSSSIAPLGTNTWLAYYKPAGMDAATVRLLPRSDFEVVGFRDAQILGSNDSTSGADGTWDVLIEGVNMAATVVWTEHPLSGVVVEADLSRPPLPAILNALPASLSRGFR